MGGMFLVASEKRKTVQRSQSSSTLFPAAIEEGIGFIKPYHFQNLSTWITPVDQFFVRSHFVQPEVELQNWSLSLEGHVEKPLTFNYEQLLTYPVQTEVVTLECTGNPVGGQMVSTGEWSGLALQSLLQEARIKPGAREVILEGADEGFVQDLDKPVKFARSIPLSKAMHPDSLLAYSVNGVKLSPALGFPLRAIIPGWYGANSIKWLTRITVITEPFQGFFNTRRYVFAKKGTSGVVLTPAYELRVKAQIARPLGNSLISRGAYRIHGAAWSGESEIAAVEVTLDGGQNWQTAHLDDNRAPYAWRLWEFPWSNAERGIHVIGARAVDSRGRSQPIAPDSEELSGYGNNSIQSVKVSVR